MLAVSLFITSRSRFWRDQNRRSVVDYVAGASAPTRIPLTAIDRTYIDQPFASVSYDLSAARTWHTPCRLFGARLANRTVRVIVVLVVLVELGYLACGFGSPLRAVLENFVVLWIARGTGRHASACTSFYLMTNSSPSGG